MLHFHAIHDYRDLYVHDVEGGSTITAGGRSLCLPLFHHLTRETASLDPLSARLWETVTISHLLHSDSLATAIATHPPVELAAPGECPAINIALAVLANPDTAGSTHATVVRGIPVDGVVGVTALASQDGGRGEDGEDGEGEELGELHRGCRAGLELEA